ncbi:unannotated protein [freshwater metagenome]|uniref:Unannotated protein n=1 Tax=freshwater metagenome TaxID=449393 RepID=A0A6J6XPW5_9ZZZZ
MRPVNGQAQSTPNRFKDFLVFNGEVFAQFDEVTARDRDLLLAWFSGRGEVGVIGQRRIAAHAEIVLDPAFGRKSVVVPAHGVEHFETTHTLEAGDGVGVGVRKDVAHVQRPASGRWWRINGVHLIASSRAIEPVDTVGFPALGPAVFQPINGGLVGNLRGCGGLSHDVRSYCCGPA